MVDIKCSEQDAAGKTEPQPHGTQGTAPCVRDTIILR